MLYEVITQAIDYMRRVADLTADGTQRVEMYYRIGKQLDEKLGDRMGAQDSFEMAFVITSYSIHYTKLYESVQRRGAGCARDAPHQ